MKPPKTGKGLVIALGVALSAVLALALLIYVGPVLAMLVGLVIGLAVIGSVLYAAYVIGYRANRRLKEGRRRPRRSN